MDPILPAGLRERLRWQAQGANDSAANGKFILYWMHHALRSAENPALDVAICFARHRDLPLLVYHELAEDYPYASDRHHAFALQGHRDVQQGLRERGIESYFHLQTDGLPGGYLLGLVGAASVLVTEEMPVQPWTSRLHELAANTSTPIAVVDTSCIVPVPLIQKGHTRAFEYRNATQDLYQQRVSRAYHDQTADCKIFSGQLPFQPLDLQRARLSSLLARCKVDHSIAPVSDTRGGSKAGYARWNQFKEQGLSRYAKRRNDATIHEGVSRMSAYLHYGMVSPFRLAREAEEREAEKFLDELLIWREMSFHFCFHHADVIDSLEAIPQWARQSLREHVADEREEIYCWETLARAKSGQVLWDACQRSLLKHGELHNNLRMTWGKAFLDWTETPLKALQWAIDLNHRYALDGRDPNSYGGILWCFGQFDRPFSPEQKIRGRVRSRSCHDHQRRLDMSRYTDIVDRSIVHSMPKVAVVGAGLGGLIASRTLADHGVDVRLFEKSRGPGGRLATRRVSQDLSLDHGAQYFTARDERFCRYVESWRDQGLVATWQGRIVELKPGGEVVEEKEGTQRFVGVPGMNAIAKHIADDLCIHPNTRISALQRDAASKWKLWDDQGNDCGSYDMVIVNCPPAQVQEILEGHSDVAEKAKQVRMRPCWAAMLTAVELETIRFDAAFINEGPLSWIANDGSKPERPHAEGLSTWLLHASADWSEQHLEEHPEEVKELLWKAFESATGQTIGRPVEAIAHRWRYAMPANPLSEECLWDPEAGIGACGDWCGGPRVEGAFLSGMAVAGTLLRQLTLDQPPQSKRGQSVQLTFI